MSKFVGIAVGVIEVGIGIATGNVGLIVSGALMIASSTATLLLTPGGDLAKRQAQQTTLQLGEVPRQAVIGETAVGGSLVDAANWGGKYGTDWEGQLRSLSDCKSHSLTGLYVNDKFETFTGDGPVSGYNGQLEVYFRDGSEIQTLPSLITDHFPGWTAADFGAGITYVLIAYKADKPDAKNPVWPGGRPTFLPVLKGKLCYDPRLDSTVSGGSGAHRWDDPSTWEWSDNPIVCRYNWSRGIYACDRVDQPDMLLIGRGLSAVEQPPANMFAPANLCDEGGQFRVDGVIGADEKFLDVEERFALSVGGSVVTREGAVEIEPAQAKAPSFAFTDADILSATEKQWNEGILSDADDEWINTSIARYVEPDQKYKDHAAPVRRDIGDIIADRGPREGTVNLDMVKRATQAGVIAEIRRRLGRIWGRASVTLPPRFAEVEEGDWGTWTSDRHFNGGTKTFLVERYQMGKEWRNALQLREISSSVYAGVADLDDTSGSFTPNPPPTLVAPDSDDWALTAEIGTTGLPLLRLLGAVSVDAVQAVLFDYRIYDAGNGEDDNWEAAGQDTPTIVRKVIGGLDGGVEYEVSVSYLISGEWSPRLILGPVTTAGSSFETSLIGMSFPTSNPLTVDDAGNITVATHVRRYADKDVTVNGDIIATGLSAGTFRAVAYEDEERLGEDANGGAGVTYDLYADDIDARTDASHPYRHYVGYVIVPTAGSGTSSGTGSSPPGGACVTTDTPVMLSDGTTKPAGEIAVGDRLLTRDEASLNWGVYPVEAVEIVAAQPLFSATIGGKLLRATGGHKVYVAGMWQQMQDLGVSAGTGDVVKMTVTGAHTYVSNGILSHNVKD